MVYWQPEAFDHLPLQTVIDEAGSVLFPAFRSEVAPGG